MSKLQQQEEWRKESLSRVLRRGRLYRTGPRGAALALEHPSRLGSSWLEHHDTSLLQVHGCINMVQPRLHRAQVII
jgi:hypothetical protein